MNQLVLPYTFLACPLIPPSVPLSSVTPNLLFIARTLSYHGYPSYSCVVPYPALVHPFMLLPFTSCLFPDSYSWFKT